MTNLKAKKTVKGNSGFRRIKPDPDDIFDDELEFDNPPKLASKASKKDPFIKYSILSDASDRKPKMDKVSWVDFIERFSKPFICGSMSLKDHLECNKDPELKHKSDAQRLLTAIIPGTFMRNRRPPITKLSIELGADYSDRSVESREIKVVNDKYLRRTMLVADLDDGLYSFEELTEKLRSLKLECFLHTSFLHSKNHGRYTVYLPFDKTLYTDVGGASSRSLSWLESKIGTSINPNCWRVSQSYCMPSCPPNADKMFKYKHLKGKLLKINNFKVDKVDHKVIQAGYAPAESRTEEDFNSNADWGDLLSPFGISYSFTDKMGNQYFMGTEKRKNVILGVVYVENNTFYVLKRMKSVGPLITGRAYNPFEAYSIIHHDKDKSAATSSLLLKGYGIPIEFRKSDDLNRLSTHELASKLFPLIEFPLEVFPQCFRRLVISYAKGNQCSIAFMATVMLTTLSAAVGKSAVMQIKDGWQTLLFIWLMVVDDSGAGKTHPMDSAMKHTIKFQARERVDTTSIGGNYTDQVREIEPKKHYYTQNISIESLIRIFQKSSRGIIIHLDEIAGLFEGMNLQKNIRSIDFSNMIALFDGKSLFADSKGGPINCRESGAAIIGGIQTARYYEAFDKQLNENGMAFRFLPLAFNLEPQNFTDDSITKELEDQWAEILTWMYNIPIKIDHETGCIISEALTAETDSREVFQSFYNDFIRLQDFMPKKFRGYLPKLITYCLKFSGILHLIFCFPKYEEISNPVKKAIIEGAIKLTKYYAGQALRLTSGKTEENDQYTVKIKKCLISLRGEFKNNKLLLQRVLSKVNEQLPPKLTLTTKKLTTMLRCMDLKVKPSTANKSVVFWDDEIILE